METMFQHTPLIFACKGKDGLFTARSVGTARWLGYGPLTRDNMIDRNAAHGQSILSWPQLQKGLHFPVGP